MECTAQETGADRPLRHPGEGRVRGRLAADQLDLLGAEAGGFVDGPAPVVPVMPPWSRVGPDVA
ncbi:hypothetical protein ABT269_39170 [Streptomyces viridosporus]|uniref:hypothetical protein n=1 Tax=Streptomyces viridosporus TaxID=67581 RepID=UPI00332C74E8